MIQNPSKKNQRKQSFYDQNGFKTDTTQMNVLKYLNESQQASVKLDRWSLIVPQIQELKQTKQKQRVLVEYVRQGIPDSLRSIVWSRLITLPIKPYQHYKSSQQKKQINLDLDRTFPNNNKMKQLTTKMKNILNAIAVALPELGYCQGMNYISAIILLKLEEEQAFNVMYHIFHWENHQILLTNLQSIHRKMYVLDKLINKLYPKLHQTLANWNIDCLFYASPWFITLFCNTLPCPYALRILQIYLMEGQKILYRTALQVLKIKKRKLKKLKQFQHIIDQLKNIEDLVTSEKEINKFINQMFSIKISRKEIQDYNKQYDMKQKKGLNQKKE